MVWRPGFAGIRDCELFIMRVHLACGPSVIGDIAADATDAQLLSTQVIAAAHVFFKILVRNDYDGAGRLNLVGIFRLP